MMHWGTAEPEAVGEIRSYWVSLGFEVETFP